MNTYYVRDAESGRVLCFGLMPRGSKFQIKDWRLPSNGRPSTKTIEVGGGGHAATVVTESARFYVEVWTAQVAGQAEDDYVPSL